MYKFFLLILIFPMSLISNLPGSPSPGQYSLSSSSERHILNFDFDWKFTKSDPENAQDINFIDSNWRTLNVPHDWSIEEPFDKEISEGRRCAYLPGGIGWYRKHFSVPESLKDKKIYIRFDGVYHQSDVYVNGQHLGFRPYGYVSFEYDLTPFLKVDGENVIAVRVDHSNNPTSRWYSGSGIYRHVRLIVANPLHVAQWGTYVTTKDISEKSATVKIRTTLVNHFEHATNGTLITTLTDDSGHKTGNSTSAFKLDAGEGIPVEQIITINNPKRWSVDQPVLYKAHTIVKLEDHVVDSYETPFGIREFNFDPEKGFTLNGISMKMKGVNIHHDAGCLGTAVPKRAWERRLQTLKEIGCNAIRMSHNPPAPELLDLCDQMGFLVIDEAFDKWRSRYYQEYFDEWWQRDLQSMLLRDQNHPSIVLWSVGNEVSEQGNFGGTELLQMLVDFVHKQEPSRPVTCALSPEGETGRSINSSGFAAAMDVVSYNYQEPWYASDKEQYPNRIILGAECYPYYRGREGTHKDFSPVNPWYDVADNEYVVGQFLWAGIDYLGESSGWPSKGWSTGLINTCGFIKSNAWFHKSVWKNEPIVGIMVQHDALDIDPGKPHWSWPRVASHWNFEKYSGHVIKVETPTNCETVELVLNGASFGSRQSADYPNSTILWYVPYAPGYIKAIGRNNGQVVNTYELRTSNDPVQIILSPDRKKITADGQDIVHIEVTLIDENGILVPDEDRRITFNIEGEGTLIGVDNGDLRSHESYKGTSRITYWGRALAVVQATRTSGKIRITATAPDLPPSIIELQTVSN